MEVVIANGLSGDNIRALDDALLNAARKHALAKEVKRKLEKGTRKMEERREERRRKETTL